jgi:hypothetical protein
MRGENINKEAIVETLRRKWDAMQNHLDERGRRIWESNLRFRHVSKSAGNLSDALKAQGIDVSPETVRRTLERLGYRMQGNRKVKSSRGWTS